MSSTRGVRWLMWVDVDTADVGGDAGDPLELGVPGPVDRFRGQREGRHGQLEVAVRVGGR